MLADGSFSVWDRARNFKSNYSNELSSNREFDPDLFSAKYRPRAYIFNQSEVWNGLTDGEKNEKYLCNGLIRDWVGWQKENSYPFDLLKKKIILQFNLFVKTWGFYSGIKHDVLVINTRIAKNAIISEHNILRNKI